MTRPWKRLVVAVVAGAVLGGFCVVGVSHRIGFTHNAEPRTCDSERLAHSRRA